MQTTTSQPTSVSPAVMSADIKNLEKMVAEKTAYKLSRSRQTNALDLSQPQKKTIELLEQAATKQTELEKLGLEKTALITKAAKEVYAHLELCGVTPARAETTAKALYQPWLERLGMDKGRNEVLLFVLVLKSQYVKDETITVKNRKGEETEKRINQLSASAVKEAGKAIREAFDDHIADNLTGEQLAKQKEKTVAAEKKALEAKHAKEEADALAHFAFCISPAYLQKFNTFLLTKGFTPLQKNKKAPVVGKFDI